jgi:hypothetical protein
VLGEVLPAARAHSAGIVADVLARLDEGVLVIRAERAGLDRHDGDPQRLHLLTQGRGQSLQRRLGGHVVTRSDRTAAHPARGDVDDRATAPLAHLGQDRLDQRGRAEEVGGKQLLDLVVGCLLDGGAVAMAGVIDQDIDDAEAFLGGPHDVTHPGVVGDIERERQRRIGVPSGEIFDPGRVTSRHHNPLATVQGRGGKRSPQAGRAASDEPGGHRDCLSCSGDTEPRRRG